MIFGKSIKALDDNTDEAAPKTDEGKNQRKNQILRRE